MRDLLTGMGTKSRKILRLLSFERDSNSYFREFRHQVCREELETIVLLEMDCNTTTADEDTYSTPSV